MPSQKSYKQYGGRGITVCDEWKDFAVFLADMGEQPDGMTLERNHPDFGYSPSNCTWATPLAQARNKRNTRWLTHDGETLSLSEWAERLGIKSKTLRARLDDHLWPIERALTTKVMSVAESTSRAKDIRYGKLKNWLAGDPQPDNTKEKK